MIPLPITKKESKQNSLKVIQKQYGLFTVNENNVLFDGRRYGLDSYRDIVSASEIRKIDIRTPNNQDLFPNETMSISYLHHVTMNYLDLIRAYLRPLFIFLSHTNPRTGFFELHGTTYSYYLPGTWDGRNDNVPQGVDNNFLELNFCGHGSKIYGQGVGLDIIFISPDEHLLLPFDFTLSINFNQIVNDDYSETYFSHQTRSTKHVVKGCGKWSCFVQGMVRFLCLLEAQNRTDAIAESL